jgi:hypothetical protein
VGTDLKGLRKCFEPKTEIWNLWNHTECPLIKSIICIHIMNTHIYINIAARDTEQEEKYYNNGMLSRVPELRKGGLFSCYVTFA